MHQHPYPLHKPEQGCSSSCGCSPVSPAPTSLPDGGNFILKALNRFFFSLGEWCKRHPKVAIRGQWSVIAVYAVLLIIPVALPLPDSSKHIWTNISMFAQFAFWGIWWPFVLLSMVFMGRTWCGFLCPEGGLSEFASRRSRPRRVPRWLMWRGWPMLAFISTTTYAQMVSVYDYPGPALIILGGSSLVALGMGMYFGGGKRVWCRYLCPVSGVFSLLSKLAPVHYKVDSEAWDNFRPTPGKPVETFSCAPLVPVRTMQGGASCHMCGRCSGFRDAVALKTRSPEDEILNYGKTSDDKEAPWETFLLFFGLMGIVLGAFHWSAGSTFVRIKMFFAEWLVNNDIMWPLNPSMPWWILTNYPERNDVFTLLDGTLVVAYILGTGLVLGTLHYLLTAMASRCLGSWSTRRFTHLAMAQIPIGGAGVFLGLFMSFTIGFLRKDGFYLEWADYVRNIFLAGAVFWSLSFVWKITGLYAATVTRRCLATFFASASTILCAASWLIFFTGRW